MNGYDHVCAVAIADNTANKPEHYNSPLVVEQMTAARRRTTALLWPAGEPHTEIKTSGNWAYATWPTECQNTHLGLQK